MTKEEIIELAKQVGIARWHKNLQQWVMEPGIDKLVELAIAKERASRIAAQTENEQLKDALAHASMELRKAVFEEREACLFVAGLAKESTAMSMYASGRELIAARQMAQQIEDAIRARGSK